MEYEVFEKKNQKYVEDANTSEQFVKELRIKIEDNQEKLCLTNGIRVFEHNDERALDDTEKEILQNLKEAHDRWMAKHHPNDDGEACHTVRMRTLSSNLVS